MFENLKKSLSNTGLTIGDAIIAEAGNGEFECEDFTMSSLVAIKESCDSDEDCDDDEEYDDDFGDDFEDDFFDDDDELMDEGCKKKKVMDEACKKKKLKEEYQEIKGLVESMNVSEDEDAANDYLESMASGTDDYEIEELVNSIPVEDQADPITNTDDDLEVQADSNVVDPTIEELAAELEDDYYI